MNGVKSAHVSLELTKHGFPQSISETKLLIIKRIKFLVALSSSCQTDIVSGVDVIFNWAQQRIRIKHEQRKSTMLSLLPSAIGMCYVWQIGYYFETHIITISRTNCNTFKFHNRTCFEAINIHMQASHQLIRIHLLGCWIQLHNSQEQ